MVVSVACRPKRRAEEATKVTVAQEATKQARETAMEEKKNGDQGGEVPEELKNVAAEVKPFDSTATIRKQIDEQQAVLTSLFHVFDDVDVEDCKFKITQVAKNLLGLEGQHDCHVISGFCETLRPEFLIMHNRERRTSVKNPRQSDK